MNKISIPSLLRPVMVLGLSLLFFELPENPSRAAQDGAGSDLERRKHHTLNVLPPETANAFGIQSFLEFEVNLKQLNQEILPSLPLAEAAVTFLRGCVTDIWGIKAGWDETLPAAIFQVNRPPQDDQPQWMIALPISNMTAMTANFDLTPDTMPPGKMIATGQKKIRNQWLEMQSFRYAGIRGQHLILGNHSDSMKTVLKGGSLGDQLSAEERAIILDDDMFFYVHRENTLKQNEKDTTLQTLIDWQPLLELQDIDRVLFGMNLDETIEASCLLTTHGERARKLLARQIEQHPAASLTGLPKGNLLAAYAISETHQEIELGLMDLISTSAEAVPLWGDVQPNLPRGLLNNLTDVVRLGWHQVAGFRSAIYQNEQALSNGQFCLVTILETADPEQFVADMTGLAPFVNLAIKEHAPGNGLANPAVVDSLIKALGSRNFRTRHLATTKLALIGVPALSQLQQASQSDNLEVRFRARKIIKQIQECQVEAAENISHHALLSELKPQLVYQADQEMREDHSVDYIRLEISDEQADVKNHLRYLFGPDWHKIRLVTVDKQVLLVLGSNSKLIEQTLTHLDEGTSGLAEMPQLSPQQPDEAGKKVAQFHVSLSVIDALMDAPSDANPVLPNTLTSHALSIKPNRVRLDIVAPYSEIKALSDLFFGNN